MSAVGGRRLVGATILINLIAEHPLKHSVEAIVQIAVPFVGEGGWPGDNSASLDDLGSRLRGDTPVFLFHELNINLHDVAQVIIGNRSRHHKSLT